MDAAVVYCSQTGSAKTYASWMAEELGCTPKPLDNIEIAAAKAELVIFVSWFHAASLKGTKRFQAYMAEHPEAFDPRAYLKPAREAVKNMVQRKIRNVLGSSNKI